MTNTACSKCKGIVFDGGLCRGCLYLDKINHIAPHIEVLRSTVDEYRKKRNADVAFVAAVHWAVRMGRQQKEFYEAELERVRGVEVG